MSLWIAFWVVSLVLFLLLPAVCVPENRRRWINRFRRLFGMAILEFSRHSAVQPAAASSESNNNEGDGFRYVISRAQEDAIRESFLTEKLRNYSITVSQSIMEVPPRVRADTGVTISVEEDSSTDAEEGRSLALSSSVDTSERNTTAPSEDPAVSDAPEAQTPDVEAGVAGASSNHRPEMSSNEPSSAATRADPQTRVDLCQYELAAELAATAGTSKLAKVGCDCCDLEAGVTTVTETFSNGDVDDSDDEGDDAPTAPATTDRDTDCASTDDDESGELVLPNMEMDELFDSTAKVYIPKAGEPHIPPPSNDDDESSQTDKEAVPTLATKPSKQVPPPAHYRLVPNGCAICLSTIDTDEKMSWASNPDCPHTFHTECIMDWLMASGRKELKRRRREERRNGTTSDVDPIARITQVSMACPCCRQPFIIDHEEEDDDDEADSDTELDKEKSSNDNNNNIDNTADTSASDENADAAAEEPVADSDLPTDAETDPVAQMGGDVEQPQVPVVGPASNVEASQPVEASVVATTTTLEVATAV